MTTVVVRPDAEVGAEVESEEIDAQPPIDLELLEEAQWQLQAASPNEAINEILRRFVEDERGRRRAARERLQQMIADGDVVFRDPEAGGE